MSSVLWTFVYEDDTGLWCPRRTPEVDTNTLRAVETFVLPFGTRAWSVQDGLDVWRDGCGRVGIGFGVSTPSAAVERISDEEVELRDRYGQFDSVVMSADEFEDMLLALKRAMIERDPASAAPHGG